MRTPIPITRSHHILNTQAPPRTHCCKATRGGGTNPFHFYFLHYPESCKVPATSAQSRPAFTGSNICLEPTVRKRCPSLEGLLVLLFSLSFFPFSTTEPVLPEQPQDRSLPFFKGLTALLLPEQVRILEISYWSFCCSFLSLLFKARPEMMGAYL